MTEGKVLLHVFIPGVGSRSFTIPEDWLIATTADIREMATALERAEKKRVEAPPIKGLTRR